MPYRILMFICLCLSLSACLRVNKPESIDSRCNRELKTAQQLHATQAKTAKPADLALSEQLIRAARIARQQQAFINCLDKSSRAISLLDPNRR